MSTKFVKVRKRNYEASSGAKETTGDRLYCWPVATLHRYEVAKVHRGLSTSVIIKKGAIYDMRYATVRVKLFVFERHNSLFGQCSAALGAHNKKHTHPIKKLETVVSRVVACAGNNYTRKIEAVCKPAKKR